MTERQQKIEALVNEAIEKFNECEEYLIKNDLSERCICAKFMTYLEQVIATSEFQGYVVDVEYNRGYNKNECAAKMFRGRKIVVDLIVHKRDYVTEIGFDNLLCVEMKKAYKHISMENDKERLKCMTNNVYGFGYEAGFMIVAVRNGGENKLVVEEIFYNEDDE